MPKSQEEINNIFMYHATSGNQPIKYEAIRQAAKDFAQIVNELCPDSREKLMAFTELETACFWANAAIARNEQ
jgi:hypothetical protein